MDAKKALLYLSIAAVSLSYGYLDWQSYRAVFQIHPHDWYLYLHGGIDAPLQYRIGSWLVAALTYTKFHMSEWLTLTLIDVGCLMLTFFSLFLLLEKNPVFRSMTLISKALSVTGVFAIVEYYIVWGHWFQYSGTLPSILFVTLSLLLISGTAIQSQWLTFLLLIVLSFVQGFFRADVAVIFHLGFILGALLPTGKNMPLGRFAQAFTSAIAAFVAGCVQLYLMLVRFPAAHYGSEGVFQLKANLFPLRWMTALLALFPFWLFLWFFLFKKYRPDVITRLFTLSCLLYCVLWYFVGQLDEVRIFIPFGIALAPATSLALTQWFESVAASYREGPIS